ncbi:MAG: zinc ABC transporter substrate-binding protein [Muribaculaceae bacterium]|nr:zinc ABC transporter substrate-binding protein [Muribaculaceae bacterium]
MIFTRALTAPLLSLSLLTLLSCGNSGEGEGGRVLATTSPPLSWAAKAVAGPGWEVVTMLPDGADPETYEPTLATMRDLASSRALFTFDTPGFEENLSETAGHNFASLRLVNVGEGIPRLEDTHHHDHHHGHDAEDEHGNHDHDDYDPHLATTPFNMRIAVANIGRAMAEIDPANAALYRHRADSVLEHLDSLDARLMRELAPSRGRAFVMMHPSLSYFARRYGLRQLTLGRKGAEESPAEYARRVGEARGAAVMVAETSQDPMRARETARTLGVPLVTVPLNSEHWQDALLQISSFINQCHRSSSYPTSRRDTSATRY